MKKIYKKMLSISDCGFNINNKIKFIILFITISFTMFSCSKENKDCYGIFKARTDYQTKQYKAGLITELEYLTEIEECQKNYERCEAK